MGGGSGRGDGSEWGGGSVDVNGEVKFVKIHKKKWGGGGGRVGVGSGWVGQGSG